MAAVIVVVAVESVLPDHGTWLAVKGVIAALALVEGFALASNWEDARREVSARALAALGRSRHFGLALRPLLFVVGVLGFAFGAFELVGVVRDAV